MMSEKSEKTYTLRSVQAELKRLNKSREKKLEKIQSLKSELKAENAQIKELESIYDRLYHEDLQNQIAAVWFKEKKMTGEQIEKFLELSRQIHDKIDVLDVATIVQAITSVYQEHKQETGESVNPISETESPSPVPEIPKTNGLPTLTNNHSS